MFMISKFMYDAVYNPREFLKIHPYEAKNHINANQGLKSDTKNQQLTGVKDAISQKLTS